METRAFEPQYLPNAGNAVGTLLPSTTVTPLITAVATPVFAGVTGGSANYKQQMLVSNTTTSWAYINFGVFGNITAATVAAGLPIAPGVARVFTVDKEVSGASVILGAASTGGTTVVFTRGEGL